MIETPRQIESRPPTAGRRIRLRLTTLLVAVAICAVGLSAYVRYRAARTPWERTGGMIGWSQAAIESRLGPPTEAVPVELPDPLGRRARPTPPGPCRTLIYRTFDGTFVVWLNAGPGGFSCFRSRWAERNTYY